MEIAPNRNKTGDEYFFCYEVAQNRLDCIIFALQTNHKPMLTTLQLINHIVSNPHYTTIAIDGCDDKTPMQAIDFLSSDSSFKIWSINGSLEENTLIVYERSAFLDFLTQS